MQQSMLRYRTFLKVVIAQAARVCNTVIKTKSEHDAFFSTFGEPCYFIPLAFGCLVWGRALVKNMRENGKLFPCLMSESPSTRAHGLVPISSSKIQRTRDYYCAERLQYPVHDYMKVCVGVSIALECLGDSGELDYDEGIDHDDDDHDSDEQEHVDLKLKPPARYRSSQWLEGHCAANRVLVD
eukprot:3644309-Amphidinium_carterae.2